MTSKDQSSFNSLLNKVHLGNTPSFFKQIPRDTIALTITSPPYYDADLYVLDDDTLEFGWGSYEEYLDHLDEMLTELFKITIPSGKVVLVLSNSPQTIEENEEITHYWPIAHDVVSSAVRIGWEMFDEIIWLKSEDSYNYINNRASPESNLRVKHDIITVLRKPGKFRVGNTTINQDSVWKLESFGPVKKYNKMYPSFPSELVKRCIDLWSLPQDIIFDPYAGSGQVCRIALKMDRFTIGVEVDEKWQTLWNDINDLDK